MRLAGLLLVAVVAAPTFAGGTSLSPSAVQEPTPLPGGLADPAGRTGYLANPHGGIDAIDLKNGELLWTTTEAEKPLFLQGSRLVAQAGTKRNRIRILVFDAAQQGQCVLESDPVVLPPWVVAGEAVGHSFDGRWRLEHNQAILTWTATARYVGPNQPTPKQQAAAERHACGTARIDLDTGQVQLGEAEPALAEPTPPGDLIENMSVRWQAVRGGRFWALIREGLSDRELLVLRSWDTSGKSLTRQELARGKQVLVLPTLDGQHLCLREAPPRPDPKAPRKPDQEHAWAIFTIDTGLPLARLPYEPGTQAITILAGRAFIAVADAVNGRLDQPQLQTRTLRAVDIKSGKLLWEHAVAGRLLIPPSR
jgi:hypothetical protein